MGALAVVVNMGQARQATANSGERTIVDVTIRGLSGPAGASVCEFPIFFQATETGTK